MRRIDIETWPRREHFEIFKAYDYPHFSMCANVELKDFYLTIKQRGSSFNVAVVYVLARAANAIPEFRLRIREDNVVEHGTVHPSTTVLTDNDLFSFCTIRYTEDFSMFAASAAERIEMVKNEPTLKDEPGRDDLLFLTAIPWVSFTSFMHPLHLNPADSVPRIAWGKRFEEGGILKMPLSVQGHHALMDGLHMGQFYSAVQAYLNDPVSSIGVF